MQSVTQVQPNDFTAQPFKLVDAPDKPLSLKAQVMMWRKKKFAKASELAAYFAQGGG